MKSLKFNHHVSSLLIGGAALLGLAFVSGQMMPSKAAADDVNPYSSVIAELTQPTNGMTVSNYNYQTTNDNTPTVNSTDTTDPTVQQPAIKSFKARRVVTNQQIMTEGPLNYQMRVTHNGYLYNLPAHTKGSKIVNSTKNLGLYHKWVAVNRVADTNRYHGFYRFNYNDQNFWIPGQDLMFNLKALRGHNKRIEKVISYGERMIDHSKYADYTIPSENRYQCSSFMSHIMRHGGIYISPDVWNIPHEGRAISMKHLRRGDLFFFQARGQAFFAHVAMYLGDGLFLHDSPTAYNGGADVSSLRDPVWNCNNRFRECHPNGYARRFF